MPVCTHCNLWVVCNVNMSAHNWSLRNTCAREPGALCLSVTLTFPAVPSSHEEGQAQVWGSSCPGWHWCKFPWKNWCRGEREHAHGMRWTYGVFYAVKSKWYFRLVLFYFFFFLCNIQIEISWGTNRVAFKATEMLCRNTWQKQRTKGQEGEGKRWRGLEHCRGMLTILLALN